MEVQKLELAFRQALATGDGSGALAMLQADSSVWATLPEEFRTAVHTLFDRMPEPVRRQLKKTEAYPWW